MGASSGCIDMECTCAPWGRNEHSPRWNLTLSATKGKGEPGVSYPKRAKPRRGDPTSRLYTYLRNALTARLCGALRLLEPAVSSALLEGSASAEAVVTRSGMLCVADSPSPVTVTGML